MGEGIESKNVHINYRFKQTLSLAESIKDNTEKKVKQKLISKTFLQIIEKFFLLEND